MKNQSDQLTKSPVRPVTRCGTLKQFGVALVVGLLLVHRALAGSFVPTGSMHEARRGHTATRLADGKVLVAGGYSTTNWVESAELYDPATGTWTVPGGPNTPRDLHTATLLPNGKVLVAGGEIPAPGGGARSSAGAELYDPTTGSWSVTGAMNLARQSHTATLLTNGKVLVAGGETYDGTNYSWVATAELYDPVTGLWTVTGSLTDPREYHAATLLETGKVLVAAGGNFTNGYLNTAELYDPATGLWTVTGSLGEGRDYPSATLLSNGQVLLAGGQQCCGAFLTEYPIAGAELYDPGTGSWTPTGELINARASQTAVVLPNGHVLVTGGAGLLGIPLYSAEEFDPVSGVWASIGDMSTNRYGHTATLLANGKVLVAGGSLNPYDSSAELYDGGGVITLEPPRLTTPKLLPDGSFQFSITNSPGALFNVLCTTNVALPIGDWTVVGAAMELLPGQFQFMDRQATELTTRFYRIVMLP